MSISSIRNVYVRRVVLVVFMPFAAAYLLAAFICAISYEMYRTTRDVVVDAIETVRECAADIRTVWRGPTQ